MNMESGNNEHADSPPFMPQLCGCGRPVRYIVPNGDGTSGSCNNRMRCSTWDELHEQNKELRGRLAQYETLMKLFKDLSAADLSLTHEWSEKNEPKR